MLDGGRAVGAEEWPCGKRRHPRTAAALIQVVRERPAHRDLFQTMGQGNRHVSPSCKQRGSVAAWPLRGGWLGPAARALADAHTQPGGCGRQGPSACSSRGPCVKGSRTPRPAARQRSRSRWPGTCRWRRCHCSSRSCSEDKGGELQQQREAVLLTHDGMPGASRARQGSATACICNQKIGQFRRRG